MYEDRERQTAQEKKKQEETRKKEMEEYERENRAKEAKGEQVVKSFDEWQKQKKDKKKKEEEEEESRKKQQENTSVPFQGSATKSNPLNDDIELDDEDKKVLDETQKMGNRRVSGIVSLQHGGCIIVTLWWVTSSVDGVLFGRLLLLQSQDR